MANYKWEVHPHAITQAEVRFGIRREHARNFINQMMEHTVKVHSKYANRDSYVHKTKDFFAAVDKESNLVITVIDKKIEDVQVYSPFLDATIAKLEKELANMHLNYKRKYRELTSKHGEMLIKRGEALQKRAAVYNPLTQSILAREAKSFVVKAEEVEQELRKLQEDYDAARVKLAKFVYSCQEKGGAE